MNISLLIARSIAFTVISSALMIGEGAIASPEWTWVNFRERVNNLKNPNKEILELMTPYYFPQNFKNGQVVFGGPTTPEWSSYSIYQEGFFVPEISLSQLVDIALKPFSVEQASIRTSVAKKYRFMQGLPMFDVRHDNRKNILVTFQIDYEREFIKDPQTLRYFEKARENRTYPYDLTGAINPPPVSVNLSDGRRAFISSDKDIFNNHACSWTNPSTKVKSGFLCIHGTIPNAEKLAILDSMINKRDILAGTSEVKPIEQLQPIAPGGSYAYPSPEEFAQFKKGLKPSPVSLSAVDRKARQDFQAEWKKKNSAIAPYVGAWKTADNQDVYVFPSKVAGRVCVLRLKDGKLSPDLGVSMTTDMRYDGNNGLFKVDTLEVVAGRSSKTQPLSAFYGAIGSPDVSSIKGEFEQAQCISELPKGGAIVAKKPLLISPDSRNPINSTIQPQSITLAPKGSSSNSSASSSILPSDPKTSSNLNRWFTPLSPNETDLSKWFTPSSLPTDAEIRAQLIQTLRGNQFLSPGMYNSLYSHQPLNIVFGKYQERTITKAKTEIEMDFYNFGILGGTLEVYDSSGNLKSIKFFEGKENIATDFANFYIESGKITLKQFTEKNGALAIAKKSKIEPFEVVDGDFIVITKESKIAQIYNYVGVFVDLLDASTSAFNMGDKKSGLGLLRTKDGRIGFSREFISQLAKQSASTSKETLEITLNDLLVKLAKTELPDFIASIKNGEKLDKALQNKPTLSNLFNSALAASKNGLNSTEFKESLAKAGLNATISGLADISGASMLLDSAFIFSKSTDIFSRVNQLRRIEVSSTKGLKLQNLTTKIFSGDGIVYDSSSIKAVRWWSDGSYEVIKELPLVEKEILDEGGIKGEMRIYSDGNTRYIERFIEKTNRGANS